MLHPQERRSRGLSAGFPFAAAPNGAMPIATKHGLISQNPFPRMTLDELTASLPNGFHDAKLKSVSIDYVNRNATLELDIWVGELDASSKREREKYRPGQLRLLGMIFWVSEPPCVGYPYDIGGELRIDVGSIQTLDTQPSLPLPSTPQECFINWIFVTDWNAFIYVAARHAQLTWHA